jgi:hypothetical protein
MQVRGPNFRDEKGYSTPGSVIRTRKYHAAVTGQQRTCDIWDWATPLQPEPRNRMTFQCLASYTCAPRGLPDCENVTSFNFLAAFL